MSRKVPWAPPPGGGVTRTPVKVRFKDVPPGSRIAAALYQRLKPEIDKFYLKANQLARLGDQQFTSSNTSRDGARFRYIQSGTQEIVEIIVEDALIEQAEEFAQELCWDWVLLEVHPEEDPYAGAIEFYAQRVIPAAIEEGVDDEGRVYDPSDTAEDAVDGLEPPVTSYPGPTDTPDIIEYTSEDGLRVSSLLIDMRRFGAGGTAVDLWSRVPAGTRTVSQLVGWQHVREPAFPAGSSIRIEFDYSQDTVIGIAVPSPGPSLPWITPPTSFLPEGTLSDGVNTDQDPLTTLGESFVNSVSVANAPADPVVIDEDRFDFAAQEALGPNANMTFQSHQVLAIEYHQPSGLVETIEQTEARWLPYAGGIGGNEVFLREFRRRWTVEETYTNVPVPVPLKIDAEIRLVAGFGEPPFTAVKVTADDGTTQGADHTRWGIVDGDGQDQVRFVNSFKAADVVLETSEDWTLVGRLIISPCQQAASFAVA